MKKKRICCTKKREVVISSFFCDSRGSIEYNQLTKKFSKNSTRSLIGRLLREILQSCKFQKILILDLPKTRRLQKRKAQTKERTSVQSKIAMKMTPMQNNLKILTPDRLRKMKFF